MGNIEITIIIIAICILFYILYLGIEEKVNENVCKNSALLRENKNLKDISRQ